jgi:hypothetical protein
MLEYIQPPESLPTEQRAGHLGCGQGLMQSFKHAIARYRLALTYAIHSQKGGENEQKLQAWTDKWHWHNIP